MSYSNLSSHMTDFLRAMISLIAPTSLYDVDAVRWTLQQPYHGAHKVVKRGAKTFTVDVNGKQEVISLDR